MGRVASAAHQQLGGAFRVLLFLHTARSCVHAAAASRIPILPGHCVRAAYSRRGSALRLGWGGVWGGGEEGAAWKQFQAAWPWCNYHPTGNCTHTTAASSSPLLLACFHFILSPPLPLTLTRPCRSLCCLASVRPQAQIKPCTTVGWVQWLHGLDLA